MLMPSKTLGVSIDRDPEAVAAFIANPRNLPLWAAGLGHAVRETESGWVVETAQGPVGLRFAPENDYGVTDHTVTVSPEVTVYVPMRVVANGTGSEVLLTLFRQPGMGDDKFIEDQELVQADLERLKVVLEG